jgi:hypothetical protein
VASVREGLRGGGRVASVEAAVLMLGDRVISRLEDIQPDVPWSRAWRVPWFVGRVTTTEAFGEVEPLFRRELALTESPEPFDVDAWQETWQQLWQCGVSLLLPDGSRVERDFVVHVYEDGTARFRY